MNVDIFLSYSSKEKDVAEYVCEKLEKAGLPCWMAHRDIPIGSDYAEQIPDAIANCKVFLLLMSDHAQKSKYVRRELNEAVDREKKVIPFYIKKTELNNSFQFLLKQYQHIEGFKNTPSVVGLSYSPTFAVTANDHGLRDEAIEQLIKQVRSHLGYSDKAPEIKEPVELPPPQLPIIIQSESPKRYTSKKKPIVCPKCSDGNLKTAKYLPEAIVSELCNFPAVFSVSAGTAISMLYLAVYAIVNTNVQSSSKVETTTTLETTPIIETSPIGETIPIGEKLSAIGSDILTGLGNFLETIFLMLIYLLPVFMLIGIVSFVIYLILRICRNHFTMIKKSKMRIWSFQCCSCMHRFSIISKLSDNMDERIPNLVKEPVSRRSSRTKRRITVDWD